MGLEAERGAIVAGMFLAVAEDGAEFNDLIVSHELLEQVVVLGAGDGFGLRLGFVDWVDGEGSESGSHRGGKFYYRII